MKKASDFKTLCSQEDTAEFHFMTIKYQIEAALQRRFDECKLNSYIRQITLKKPLYYFSKESPVSKNKELRILLTEWLNQYGYILEFMPVQKGWCVMLGK